MYNDTEKMLDSLTSQLCALLIIAKKLGQMGLIRSNTFSELMNEFIFKSEKMTCYARDVALKTFCADRKILFEGIAQNNGINVKKENGIIEIEIPFLLPKKTQKKASFICDPLFYSLIKASEKTDLKINENAVVWFVNIYDNKTNKIAVRDYDNLESKKILDTIALFSLKDDSAEFCDIIYSMEFGTQNKTMIYVIPKTRLFELELDPTKMVKTRQKNSSHDF